MRRFFEQYKGLKREMYILFYGRIVTSMGSLIWPLVTLILKNKMGMTRFLVSENDFKLFCSEQTDIMDSIGILHPS